jgi:hypothetical protein
MSNDGNQRMNRINLSKDNGSQFHPAYAPKGPMSEGVPMEKVDSPFPRMTLKLIFIELS